MGLPFQALLLPGQQAAEGQCGGGPLDQHGVHRAGRAVADQDDPAPVLAPGADRGHQPAGALLVGGARRRGDGPGPGLEPGQQPSRVGARRLAGQHVMGQILEQQRQARQQAGLAEDLAGPGARHGQVGEHLVQPGRGAQLVQLVADDPRMHRLGDLDERHLMLEHDQRQVVCLGRGNEAGRQPAGVLAAQLHGERAGPDPGQPGHVRVELRPLVGQRDAGAEHEFPAVQQPGRVGQLDHVHPAHRVVQPARGRHHPGQPALHHVAAAAPRPPSASRHLPSCACQCLIIVSGSWTDP